MELQRNLISMIEEEKKQGIYCSFPCVDDNTHDYLLLEDIQKINLLSGKRTRILLDLKRESEISIPFKLEYKEGEHAFINGQLIDVNGKPSKLEIQDVADEFCKSFYDETEFEDSPLISKAIDEATNNVLDLAFEESGVVVKDKTYYSIGKIYNSDNKIVGIVNDVSFTLNSDTVIAKLNNIVSYTSLKGANLDRIEFKSKSLSIILRDINIINNIEGLLRNYVVEVNNVLLSESEGAFEILSFKDIDESTVFDSFESHLSRKEEVLGIKQETTINDMFDDFDF